MDNVPPPPYPGQPLPKRGWWQQNWKWFVPTGCVTLLVVPMACSAGIFFVAMTALKSSDPYKVAVERAEANPQLAEALGKPITAGMLVTGSVHANGSTSDADIAIPLTGSSGKKATLNVTGTKTDGVWTYSKISVRVDGSEEVIDLSEATP